jgi:hypothetical protein
MRICSRVFLKIFYLLCERVKTTRDDENVKAKGSTSSDLSRSHSKSTSSSSSLQFSKMPVAKLIVLGTIDHVLHLIKLLEIEISINENILILSVENLAGLDESKVFN